MTAQPARFDRMGGVAAAICVVVVVLRVVLAFLTPAPELVEDAAGYHLAAQRLLDDGYYAYVHPEDAVENPAPNATVLPGYVFFLAALYRLFGIDPQPLVSVAQAVLSGLTMWGIFVLGRRMAGPRAGLAAVALAAAYPPFWWSYRYVLTEDLFTLLVVWGACAMLAAYRMVPGLRWAVGWLGVGALAALSTLVRAVGGVWVLAAGLVLLAASRGSRRRVLLGGVVALITAVCVMTPWWIRNAGIYDAFVPLNTKFAGTELTFIVQDREELARLTAPFQPKHLDAKADYERQAGLAELTRELREKALRDDALGYVVSRLRATAISVFTYHPNPFMGFTGWGGVTEAVHLLVLVAAAYGFWRARRSPEAWVLLALPIVVVVLHTPTLIFSRYLFPAMPFAMVFAGMALGGTAILHGSRVDLLGESHAGQREKPRD